MSGLSADKNWLRTPIKYVISGPVIVNPTYWVDTCTADGLVKAPFWSGDNLK